jgi:hypothetical protein
MRPYLKKPKWKQDWQSGLIDRTPGKLVWLPEFKPQYCQKQTNNNPKKTMISLAPVAHANNTRYLVDCVQEDCSQGQYRKIFFETPLSPKLPEGKWLEKWFKQLSEYFASAKLWVQTPVSKVKQAKKEQTRSRWLQENTDYVKLHVCHLLISFCSYFLLSLKANPLSVLRHQPILSLRLSA